LSLKTQLLHVCTRNILLCGQHRDEKFALTRTVGVAFGAIGGTSLGGADLSCANFSHAILTLESIQAIERKGDEVLVILEVAVAIDKVEIFHNLQATHERVRKLESKVERLWELHVADPKDIALQKT
jgi:hypothetical protein